MPGDITKNSTSISTLIRITDFEGFPATTIVFNTVGFTVWYRRDGGLKVIIPLVALAAVDSAYSSGGFIHVGDGYYRVDVPNAAFVTGSNGVQIAGGLSGFKIDGSYHTLVEPAAGTGARSVTITVNDGTNPIQGALVRVTKGAETYLQTTPVNGVVNFSLDDGTWTVSITANNYSFVPVSLVVDGIEAVTYSMTPILSVPAPPTGNQITGLTYTYNHNGVIEVSKKVYAQMVKPPDLVGTFDSAIAEYTSDPATGAVVIGGMFIGATYHIWRGRSNKMKYTVPTPGVGITELNLPPLLGNDSTDPCLT